MVYLVPKPDLRKLVDAIREQTQLAAEDLTPLLGEVPYDIEQALRQIVTRAIERGIDLQRDALGLNEDSDSIDTPLRPTPPDFEVPLPPKLPEDD